MSFIIDIHEAQTRLLKLLACVSNGEKIVIAQVGVPIARLMPFAEWPARRMPGSARGTFVVPENFDDSLPEDILASFEQ